MGVINYSVNESANDGYANNPLACVAYFLTDRTTILASSSETQPEEYHRCGWTMDGPGIDGVVAGGILELNYWHAAPGASIVDVQAAVDEWPVQIRFYDSSIATLTNPWAAWEASSSSIVVPTFTVQEELDPIPDPLVERGVFRVTAPISAALINAAVLGPGNELTILMKMQGETGSSEAAFKTWAYDADPSVAGGLIINTAASGLLHHNKVIR